MVEKAAAGAQLCQFARGDRALVSLEPLHRSKRSAKGQASDALAPYAGAGLVLAERADASYSGLNCEFGADQHTVRFGVRLFVSGASGCFGIFEIARYFVPFSSFVTTYI